MHKSAELKERKKAVTTKLEISKWLERNSPEIQRHFVSAPESYPAMMFLDGDNNEEKANNELSAAVAAVVAIVSHHVTYVPGPEWSDFGYRSRSDFDRFSLHLDEGWMVVVGGDQVGADDLVHEAAHILEATHRRETRPNFGLPWMIYQDMLLIEADVDQATHALCETLGLPRLWRLGELGQGHELLDRWTDVATPKSQC